MTIPDLVARAERCAGLSPFERATVLGALARLAELFDLAPATPLDPDAVDAILAAVERAIAALDRAEARRAAPS